MTKRTLMFMVLVAALLCGGCSSAQAACPGGRCASLGVWSPWGGVWYYQSPCAGGKCAVKKPAAEPEEPKVEEEADHFRESAEMVAEPADTAPEIVEEPIEAQPSVCEIVSEIVNRHRERMGLPALEIDPILCQGCEEHSVWMAANGFRHAYGIGGRECIAMGIRSPEAVVTLWLGSDGHRAILLGTGHAIGVGRCGAYWTLRVR